MVTQFPPANTSHGIRLEPWPGAREQPVSLRSNLSIGLPEVPGNLSQSASNVRRLGIFGAFAWKAVASEQGTRGNREGVGIA